EHCELRLVKDGVWIDSRTLRDCGTHLIAVIEGENLRKDVSQAKIVADVTLERIELSLRQLRWKLWSEAVASLAGRELEQVEAMLIDQLLDHSTLKELREIPEAVALSERHAWSDCRDPERRVTLRELVERVGAGETISYSRMRFPELSPEGAPILLLAERGQVERLARTLGQPLVEADNLLARERRRVIGYRAWLAREGKPELPRHLEFFVRASIERESGAGPIGGEIGLEVEAIGTFELAHVFLFKSGRLLGRAELDLEMPGLWLAIDANFEPNDDYTDAVRDRAFMQILLHSLASLHEPFGQLLAESDDARSRGLVKRWLISLCDQKSQVALLTRAGVDVGPGEIGRASGRER